MTGQMSFVDVFPELFTSCVDIENLTLDEVAKFISDNTGVELKYVDGLWGYVGYVNIPNEKKKAKVDINLSHYNYKERLGVKFISAGISTNIWGASGPFDSLDSAVNFLNSYISGQRRVAA